MVERFCFRMPIQSYKNGFKNDLIISKLFEDTLLNFNVKAGLLIRIVIIIIWYNVDKLA